MRKVVLGYGLKGRAGQDRCCENKNGCDCGGGGCV